MPVDPRVKTLVPMHDHFTPEREMLAHARKEADELGLDDYFVVDVDSHRDPGSVWPAILRHMENPVMRSNSAKPAGMPSTIRTWTSSRGSFSRAASSASESFLRLVQS